MFLDSHAAFSPYIASRSICTHQATLLFCWFLQENNFKSRILISFIYMGIIIQFWPDMYSHIYMCVYIYKNIYKPPFRYIFKALIFPINQPALVSGTFHLIFCWLLITRYCFSRKQTTKLVWCSRPGFNTSATYFQHHTAMPPHLQSLVPHLSSALWLWKSWVTSTFYHHLLDSSLYLPQGPLCPLQSDSFYHLYEFWLVFLLLDYLFLACHLNFFWVIVIIEPTFINSTMHCRYGIIKSFDFWAIWLLNDSNKKHVIIMGVSPGNVSTIKAFRT